MLAADAHYCHSTPRCAFHSFRWFVIQLLAGAIAEQLYIVVVRIDTRVNANHIIDRATKQQKQSRSREKLVL